MTDLEFVRDLAQRAGTLALAATRAMTCERKADQSLVTNIDRGVEEMVRRELLARFPSDEVYGEEEGGDPYGNERLWIVDPIDGTTNMVFGLPVWGVSIGLAVCGEPTLGAFYLPRVQEMYWFERGEGAYRDGTRLQARDTGPLVQEDTLGIGSEAFFLVDFAGFPCRQRNFGSLAAHFCYAGAGQLRANLSVSDKLHDLGAGFGVALEAGCVVEYLEGGTMPFSQFLEVPHNLRPILVGPPETVERVREVIRLRPASL